MPGDVRLRRNGKRDLAAILLVGAYLLITSISVSNIVPVRFFVQNSKDPLIVAYTKQAMRLPYIGRVETKMLEIGASSSEITRKVGFMAASLVTMIGLYCGLGLVGSVLLLPLDIRNDPAALRLSRVPALQHLILLPFAMVMLGGAGLFFWMAVDGFGILAPDIVEGRYADYIVENDFSIDRSILCMTASFGVAITVVRVAFCYVTMAVNLLWRSRK